MAIWAGEWLKLDFSKGLNAEKYERKGKIDSNKEKVQFIFNWTVNRKCFPFNFLSISQKAKPLSFFNKKKESNS